jgi:hypothetical protein
MIRVKNGRKSKNGLVIETKLRYAPMMPFVSMPIFIDQFEDSSLNPLSSI